MATIIPKVTEQAWLPVLANLPAWQPVLRPTVVIAPHPDDESLGAGGLIARLRSQSVPVTIVAVTDGEGAYPGDDSAGLAPTRVAEQTAALARLGVAAAQIVRLRYPDSRVIDHEERLIASLRPLVGPGVQLIAPWRGDFHPDHEACGRAAETLAHDLGIELTSYLFWTWHRGEVETLADQRLVGFSLTPTECIAKNEAIQCHASQLEHGDDPILSEELLAPARRSFEVYLR